MANDSGKKQPRGVDDGSCWMYYRLSYRRKFIRTLWMLPFSPVLLFFDLPNREIWFAATVIIGLLQAGYNYWKWQSVERE